MSMVMYNGVILSNVLTQKFEQMAVYDDSNTDLLYHKFSVRVTGYLHRIIDPGTNIDILPGTWGDLSQLGLGCQSVRKLLMQPRRPFQMCLGRELNTNILLQARPPYTSLDPVNVNPDPRFNTDNGIPVDLNNGPKPINCTLTSISGNATVHVQFEIEICIIECEGGESNFTGPRGGVLSNRFSIGDEIDENWYTTRTTTGKLRLAQLEGHPAMYRSWVIPPLQYGFKRQSISCRVTPDGLSMDYTIVDKEMYASASFPASSWEATDTAETDVGAVYMRTVKVSVTGFKSAKPWDLFAVASNIVEQRLKLNAKDKSGTEVHVLQNAQLTRYLHENRIEMSVTAKFTHTAEYSVEFDEGDDPWDEGAGKLPGDVKTHTVVQGLDWRRFVLPYQNDDKDPTYRHNIWTVPQGKDQDKYGTATAAGLFLSYLNTPCYADGVPNVGRIGRADEPKEKDTAKRGEKPAETATAINVEVGPALPDKDPQAGLYIQSGEAAYTFYDIQTAYMTAQNVVSLPIASTVNAVITDENGDPVQQINPVSTAYVRMAPPQTTRKVVVVAQRYGDWPKVPSFKTVQLGDGTILKLVGDAKITPRYPEISADKKTRKYELVCEYEHIADRPFLASQALPVPRAAYDGQPLVELQVPTSIFDPTLMT